MGKRERKEKRNCFWKWSRESERGKYLHYFSACLVFLSLVQKCCWRIFAPAISSSPSSIGKKASHFVAWAQLQEMQASPSRPTQTNLRGGAFSRERTRGMGLAVIRGDFEGRVQYNSAGCCGPPHNAREGNLSKPYFYVRKMASVSPPPPFFFPARCCNGLRKRNGP